MADPNIDSIVAEYDKLIAHWRGAQMEAGDMVVRLSVDRERVLMSVGRRSEKPQRERATAGSTARPSPARTVGSAHREQARLTGSTADQGQGSTTGSKAPRSRSQQAILDALDAAGPAGLSGTEVNAAVVAAGLSRDASDKAKTRLKAVGRVIHAEKERRWYLPAAGTGN